MNERTTILLGGMIGALAGALVGFALFTERGRRMRAELQPEIDRVIREAVRLSRMVDDFKRGGPVAHADPSVRASGFPRRIQ